MIELNEIPCLATVDQQTTCQLKDVYSFKTTPGKDQYVAGGGEGIAQNMCTKNIDKQKNNSH